MTLRDLLIEVEMLHYKVVVYNGKGPNDYWELDEEEAMDQQVLWITPEGWQICIEVEKPYGWEPEEDESEVDDDDSIVPMLLS